MTTFCLLICAGKYKYNHEGKTYIGYGICSNVCMSEVKAANKTEAIVHFNKMYPEINLNNYGTCERDLLTYTVGELV
jgi:hypothetical protein